MPEMTVDRVNERVENWVDRLTSLYALLDEWAEDVPDARVDHGSLEQVVEPLMRQFHVPARSVPTWTLFQGPKRVAFVPSALWVVGANGRVNVSTSSRQHMLMDVGGKDGRPSDWQLVVDDARKLFIPFTREVFLQLVGE